MRAYISISIANRRQLNNEIDSIVAALTSFKITPLIFVDRYSFAVEDEKQMMQQAADDIDASDLLIAETSYKGIGIGIEVGYAKARNKPIIYLRNVQAEHSTTVSGISDFHVIYSDVNNLKKQLNAILFKIVTKN
jgi:2'-deoxynucleoside 5'-phosphate N-hydrolase